MKCVNLHINVRMAQFHEKYNAWGSEYTGVTKKMAFRWLYLGCWPLATTNSEQLKTRICCLWEIKILLANIAWSHGYKTSNTVVMGGLGIMMINFHIQSIIV